MNEENKTTQTTQTTAQTAHITYKEYQNKARSKKSSDGIAIFVSAFFILLLLFLGIAKQISPEVDVSIGNEDEMNTGIADKGNVDERLKLLQMEDNDDDKMFASELDEKVVIPDRKEREVKEEISLDNNDEIVNVEKEATPKPSETASPAPKSSVADTPVPNTGTSSKVVVGYYSTKEQAEVAKGIIAESGMNISPFVRSIGGAYTIQVGSYSTREKAQNVVNDLIRNNYPARIISE